MTNNTTRRPQNVRVKHDPVSLNEFAENPGKWLAKEAKAHGLQYLLAHADDGLIWGVVKSGRLLTSGEAVPSEFASLRSKTLRQCRLFSPAGELFLWRQGDQWAGRLLTDEPCQEPLALDEFMVLYGDHLEMDAAWKSRLPEFHVVADGSQGLRHAVPMSELASEHFSGGVRPLRLSVRHYLEMDPQTGQLFIGSSRLVDLVLDAKRGKKS